jgi:Family of unknown function (DUF5681)
VASGRVENLKPWAKGVSGNPGGRPRTAPIAELLRELLEKLCPGDKQNRTCAHKIAEAMLKRACQGDVRAAREVADRTEGRPTQSVIVGGECENCRENRGKCLTFPCHLEPTA